MFLSVTVFKTKISIMLNLWSSTITVNDLCNEGGKLLKKTHIVFIKYPVYNKQTYSNYTATTVKNNCKRIDCKELQELNSVYFSTNLLELSNVKLFLTTIS